MKAYRVSIFNPNDSSEIYEWQIIEAKSEILLKEIIRAKWFEIKWSIHEVEIEENQFDKIKKWFSTNFSTSYSFNPEYEVTILWAFASALKRWFTEKEALEQCKFAFWKSDVAIRNQIDKLIETYDYKWISHISDVFRMNEEMFSENFLSLIQQSKWTEIKIDKIISNPVAENEKWEQVEGYVELTRSVNHLYSELKRKISAPIFWFIWMFWLVLLILIGILPNLLEGFSKIRDISNDSYYWIWEITLATSSLLTNYWLYVLIVVFGIVGIILFLYQNNSIFKEAVHKYLINMFVVWDIIILVYTKKISSLMALYYESWMKWEKIFTIIVPLIPFIPMKKELEYIGSKVWSWDFDKIFKSYPEEEKYFTELFYVQLAKESNSHATMTWRYWMAFATILTNTDELWDKSVSKYPDKIWKVIKIVAFVIVGFYTSWIMLIFLLTTLNSV